MTVTLSLDPEQEQRLQEAARAQGVDTETLVQTFVKKGLDECETPAQVPPQRVLGLQAGKIWISDDFDAPLPESFWLGAE